MHYIVQARLIADTAADFLRKLTDGTIQKQEPDGREIVASMKRAVIDKEGVVHGVKSAIARCRSSTSERRCTTTTSLTSKQKRSKTTFNSMAGR